MQKGLFGQRVHFLFDKLSDCRFQHESTKTGVDASKNIGVKEFLSYYVPEETTALNLVGRKTATDFNSGLPCLLLLLLLLRSVSL